MTTGLNKGRQLRHLMGVVMALLVAVASPGSFAASQLFVLTNDESTLSDMNNLINAIEVPVYVLNLDRLESIQASVTDELAFINDLCEAQVTQGREQIESKARELVSRRKGELNEAYRETIVAGEISTRYGVEQLPTLIEIDSVGNYRVIANPASFEQGVLGLEAMQFTRAPPALANAAPASAQADTADNAAQCDPVQDPHCEVISVTIIVGGEAVVVPITDLISREALEAAGLHVSDVQQIIINNPTVDLSSLSDPAGFIAAHAQAEDGVVVSDPDVPADDPPQDDTELDAEGGSFAEGVGSDSVFVTPVAFEIAGHLAFVLHVHVDEVDDASGDGVSEFLGVGSFTVTEECQ